MSRLYLHCVICSRRQADGLISGHAWGRLELPADVELEHPGYRGSTLRACPTCVDSHPDWQDRAFAALGLRLDAQPRPAA